MSNLKTVALPLAIVGAMGVTACGESESNEETPTAQEPSGPSQTSEPATPSPAETSAPETPVEPEPTGAAPAGDAPEAPDATGAVFTDDFESGAAQWEVIQGSCTVTEAATQVMTCTNGGNEARAVAGEVWTDLTVTANVMIHQMDDGKRVYLAGRFTDADNWYGAALYNSGTRKVQIRKKVAGSSDDVAAENFAFEDNTWYTLQLKIAGDTLTVSVDGTEITSGTDADFTEGKVAFLVDSSEVSWDNVVVTTP